MNAPETLSTPSLVPMLASLLLILALIPAAVWLMRRLGALGGGHGVQGAQAAALKLVATLPLSPRDRVVVVEAGERWWLLGVSSNGITRLGTLPRGEAPTAPAAAGFAQLIAQARKRLGADAHAAGAAAAETPQTAPAPAPASPPASPPVQP